MRPPKECPYCGGKIIPIGDLLFADCGCYIEFDAAECVECGYIEYPGFDYEE